MYVNYYAEHKLYFVIWFAYNALFGRTQDW
jgi:hypothetical protein